MKNIMLTFAAVFCLQINGAAPGLRSSTMQAKRLLSTGLHRQATKFPTAFNLTKQPATQFSSQVTRFNYPTSRWTAFKNMFSGAQRRFTNLWPQYRKPLTFGALGFSSAGLAYYNKDLLPAIYKHPRAFAEEITTNKNSLFASEVLDFVLDPSTMLDDQSFRYRLYKDRKKNPQGFINMFLYDVKNFLTRYSENSGHIKEEAVIIQTLRTMDYHTKQEVYKDILKLTGRLYLDGSVSRKALKYNFLMLFERPLNNNGRLNNVGYSQYIDYRNFVSGLYNTLDYLIEDPSFHGLHEPETKVLLEIKSWLQEHTTEYSCI